MASQRKLTLFLIVGLIFGFIAGYGFSPLEHSLKEEISQLKADYNALNMKYNQLKVDYENLNQSYWNLKSSVVNAAIFLPDRSYYSEALRLITHANKSVYVVMYVVKFDVKELNDPVNVLLKGLVEAKNRGVDVKVLVDDQTYKSYMDTISFLLMNDIPVKLDEKAGVRTHVKMVIVDGRYVLVGSHNWTESALTLNNEVSIEVISGKIVDDALSYFNSLWENGRQLSF